VKLENALSIPVSADEAWKVLLDIERIAPCVPGATLTSQDDDGYHGRIKVKLGAIGLTYNGTVNFLSQDEGAKVAVLEASGRETRGNGTAKALVTCRLVGSGDTTDMFVETDLAITGKPAQFGRGALAEVSGALIARFAANLAEELATAVPADATPGEPIPGDRSDTTSTSVPKPADTAHTGGTSPSAPAAAPRAGAEPIDLMQISGAGALRRLLPYAAGAAALLLLAVGLRGRRRTRPIEVVIVDRHGHPYQRRCNELPFKETR